MFAIKIDHTEPGGALVPTDVDLPHPPQGHVRIKVEAAGVNRPDVLQRRGLYPPPKGASPLPGLEVAGLVDAVGPDISPDLINTPVCALVPGGGYATHVCCPASHTLPIPDGLCMIEAATLPETVLTVWSNIFQQGGFSSGETVLIHGGNSGIGSTAIQMVKAAGGQVITTVRGKKKAAYCRQLGAHHVIDVSPTGTDGRFSQHVRDLTDQQGVNICLDMIGGPYIQQNLDCLAVEGRLINIAYLLGSTAEVNFIKMMIKRQTITGSTLRPRSDSYKGDLCRAVEREVWPHIEAGRIKPHIHQSFPLEDVQKAHDMLESGTVSGKIVLKVT